MRLISLLLLLLLLRERLCLLVARDLALILLGTRRRDVVRRDERRAAHIPLTRSCLQEQLLHLKCNKGRRWKKGEREAGELGTARHPTLPSPPESGLSHVSRHIFKLHRFLLFFATPFLLPLLHLFPLLLLATILPSCPLSGSFPRFWLSLSSAIRQSSCQIKFADERSPRSARRIPCNHGDDKKWMLRNFRIGKTREREREKCIIFPPASRALPYTVASCSSTDTFFIPVDAVCFSHATPTRFSLRSLCEINACLRDKRFFIHPR